MLNNVTYQIKKKLFLSDSDGQDKRSPPAERRQGERQNATRQTAAKKKLPTIPGPDLDEYMNRSVAKQKSAATASAVLNAYGPYFLEYTLLAEYNLLQKQMIPGVYVLPAAKSPLIWYGVLFIHHGIYEEGIFKFVMSIPQNYPDGDCPLVKFVPPVYHPLVNIETGELDIKQAFPLWRRTVNHLWQVLLFARRLFYRIESSNPINEEAAMLYNNDISAFREKVKENISLCHEQLCNPIDDDPHSIRFTEWQPEKHENIKNSILCSKEKPEIQPTKNAQSSGLSWVKKGTVEIFSKNDES